MVRGPLFRDDYKPLFSGHETFPLRYGWLKKAFDATAESSDDPRNKRAVFLAHVRLSPEKLKQRCCVTWSLQNQNKRTHLNVAIWRANLPNSLLRTEKPCQGLKQTRNGFKTPPEIRELFCGHASRK